MTTAAGQTAEFVPPRDLASWGAAQRAAGRTIGFTCGAFDLLHAGHVDYLEQASALCDVLLVAINSDASIQQYKSLLRPVHPQEERLRVIAALRSVDAVTLLDAPRPLALIQSLQPQFYIKGGDYRASNLRSTDAVKRWGGQVAVIPIRFDTSTTKTLERAAALALHAEPEKPRAVEACGIVLIDRDGTLLRTVPFLHEPERVELVPGAVEALARLSELPLRFVIITNQQGIGLGYFSLDDFIAVNQAMLRRLGSHGVKISKIYYCPHSLADNCACRKPGTRLIERALKDFGFQPEQAFFIGDTGADRQAAEALGVRWIPVRENQPATWEQARELIEIDAKKLISHTG